MRHVICSFLPKCCNGASCSSEKDSRESQHEELELSNLFLGVIPDLMAQSFGTGGSARCRQGKAQVPPVTFKLIFLLRVKDLNVDVDQEIHWSIYMSYVYYYVASA